MVMQSLSFCTPEGFPQVAGSPADSSSWETDWDFVCSSQPTQDGEDWILTTSVLAPSTPIRGTYNQLDFPDATPSDVGYAPDMYRAALDASAPARRAHLIRRASPVKLKTQASPALGAAPRCLNLVRRVTPGPSRELMRMTEMAKKRQLARDAARRILKKICTHATALARLQHKHKRLSAFAAGGERQGESM
ncbi:hypothetical protein B0H10DRAFT_2436667 [Mycena sp. CBHHK59/15]|nr:hypothetical protein B0H10DRAFT_2436667 [Mycena sp. CBHHK59/15]